MSEATGRDLLNVAVDWIKSNGTVPMPSSGLVGNSNVDGSSFYANDFYTLNTLSKNEHLKDYVVSSIASVIPLIAGIALGLESKDLVKIIKNHKISIESVTYLEFGCKKVEAIKSENTPNSFITNAHICTEVVKAFVSEPDLHEELYSELSGFKSGAILLGAMHAEDLRLWPATMIDEHADLVMSQSDAHTSFKRYQGAVSEPIDISEFPKGCPGELLKRSGMLSEAVIRKQTGHFDLWEDVVFEASHESEPHVEILKHIANERDTSKQRLYIRGLLSLSADSTHHEFIPRSFMETLQKHLGNNSEFRTVLDSIILKINLTATSDYVGGIDNMMFPGLMFDEIKNDRETLLSRVAEEILGRNENDLSYSELSVFTRIREAKLPKQLISFHPEALINKVLASWENYASNGISKDREKSGMDEKLSQSILSLIKMIGSIKSLDCDQFKERTENSKVLLVESGLDVRNFKGLSRRAMGRVLENDMGM